MTVRDTHRTPLTLKHTLLVLSVLLFLLVVVSLAALSLGSISIPLKDTLATLTGFQPSDETNRTIILDIRLPRLLLAILVGAGLSIAGGVFQALLRNPLAEPYILGISSGGTAGAVLALGLSWGYTAFTTPLASFIGSGLVMFLVYIIAHRRGQLDTNTLLLSGVMVGAFFNAAVLLLVAVFNQELRNAFLWLMGSFGNASLQSLGIVSPFVLVASGFLLYHSRQYNLIATGDETAAQLGVNVAKLKRLSYIMASLITGLAVSVSGVIGFVGLIVPHMCRMMFGPDHRLLLPSSMVLGASFMIVSDLVARTILAPAEIPVGAVTAAIGAPVFIYLLRKT